MEETTGGETVIGPEDGAPSICSFSSEDYDNEEEEQESSFQESPSLCSFSSEDYDSEEEEQESSFQESTMAARRKELIAQAAAEILAVQEFKFTLSEERSHMEARRQELAAEATAKIKAVRDVKHATLARFMSGEEEEEEEDEDEIEGGEFEDEEGSYNLVAERRVSGTHGDDWEERNNNYGKADMGILASKDLPNATISTTSSTTTTTYDELLGLEFEAREHSMQLSEMQMVQSLTLATEADAHGVAVFKTTDHLNKLQFVPIYSWDHSGKPSVYWQLKEGPPLEKERSQISLRIGGMVKRAMCGIQKAFCVKPNMRRRSSREELLGLG